MPKYMDLSEEIDFLEAEILDDDDDAPVGELVVRVQNANSAPENEVTADETVEETVVTETVEETEIAPEEIAPIESAEISPAEDVAVESENVETVETTEEVETAVEEIVETPAEDVAVENEEITDNAEEVATVTEETAPEQAVESVEVKEEQPSTFDTFSTSAQAEVSDSKFDMPEPKKKAPAKKTAKPKATEQDPWGNAVVTVKKDKKAETETAETEKEVAPAKAPKAKKAAADNTTSEKAPAKKTTKKTNKENANVEEENIVAKAVDKETTKKAPTKEEKAKATKATKETAAPAEKAPVEKAPAKKAAAKEEVKETVIVEGEGKMHGKYVIKKTDNGNFVFKLFSSNHRVVAIGAQAYKDLKSCKGGVQSVINNAEKAPIENQTLKNYEEQKCPKWIIFQDKKGEYRLRLIASNGNIVATTNDGYVDISGAKNGIAAVARASKGCAVVRNDDLW